MLILLTTLPLTVILFFFLPQPMASQNNEKLENNSKGTL